MSRKDRVSYTMNLDWEELRKQKNWLLKQGYCDESEGILAILNHLQGHARQQGIPEEVIWKGDPEQE